MIKIEEKKIKFNNPKFREFILFKDEEGVRKINIPKEFLDNPNKYLRMVDLEGVCWNNVDVRGYNFKGTNASINPRTVYKRSLENTNLEGMDLSMYSFRGVKLKNTNLKYTGAHLHSGEHIFNYDLIKGCYLNGRIISDVCDADYEVIEMSKEKTMKKTRTLKK